MCFFAGSRAFTSQELGSIPAGYGKYTNFRMTSQGTSTVYPNGHERLPKQNPKSIFNFLDGQNAYSKLVGF